jgi:hypothetical protein
LERKGVAEEVSASVKKNAVVGVYVILKFVKGSEMLPWKVRKGK